MNEHSCERCNGTGVIPTRIPGGCGTDPCPECAKGLSDEIMAQIYG